MRTVITISLNGNAYQLDAVGYEALRAYLQVAEHQLAGNPDQTEILADLEQAIADKCGRYLGPHKNVVSSEEVAAVLREMGPVEGGDGSQFGAAPPASGGVGTGASTVAGANSGASAVNEVGPGDAGGVSGHAATGGGYTGAQGATNAGGLGGGDASDFGGAAAGAGAFGAARADAGGNTDAFGADPVTSGTYAGDASQGPNAGATSGTGATPGAGASADDTTPAGDPPRRLYQIREGAFISGVCKGLAAYLNIDVSVVRILFVLLAILTGGVWIFVYIVMMFLVPYAQTSEQHAAAHGWPFNAEELVARAKAHYARFREDDKWRRQRWRQERKMWKDRHKEWKDQHRAWKRWGAPQGAPPPPPPAAWGSAPAQPTNVSYSGQIANSVARAIEGILGFVFFFGFLFVFISLLTHRGVFGWWLPHNIPLWVGIVALIFAYKVVTAPLQRARYVGYYGAPYPNGLVAVVGALVWLSLLTFLGWLAWTHWPDVQSFFQQIVDYWHWMQERRAAPPADPEHAAMYFVALGAPTCWLPGYLSSREFQSHGEIDRADMLGEAAERDVIDAGGGDSAHSFQ